MAAFPPAHPSGGRLVFLDLARCLAIVLMVMAHVTDQLLDPQVWSTPEGRLYGFFRGITAPLFFLVSGWAFSVATLPRMEAYRRPGPLLFHRLLRVGALWLWGYALTLPWWAEGFPLSADPSVWGPFWAFGVLQTAGTALLVGHLAVWSSRSPTRFGLLALLLAVAAVAGAASAQKLGAHLPQPLRGAFDPAGVAGGFPLAPWIGFFLVGCALGAWAPRGWSLARLALTTGLAALVCLSTGKLLGPVFAEWMSQEAFWAASPTVFLGRLGAALLVLCLAALTSWGVRRLPNALAVPGRHALTFYVGHMVILWGTPITPGLVHHLAPTMSLVQTAAIAAACLAAIGGLLWLGRLSSGHFLKPATFPRQLGSHNPNP